jgi:ribosomal protein S18 acetylase RimI-like enzyme
MVSVLVRPLAEVDFDAWWRIRLRMLQEHPEAFGSSYEEAVARGAEEQRARFLQPHGFILGAFDGAALVGTVGCVRHQGAKVRHKAFIWAVYVAPEVRGKGVARQLMEAAIARARSEWAGLRQIHLAVVATNAPARRLYRRLGFEVYGVEPAALHVDGRDLDEELMVLR